MKKMIIVVFVIGAAVVGFLLLRPDNSSTSGQPTSTQSARTLPTDVKIYDVRTPEEYNTAHVPNAVLFPVTDMSNGKYPDIAKDTPIAVYCRSGNRSKQATDMLKQAGYTNITDLGGLNDLAKYGLKAQ